MIQITTTHSSIEAAMDFLISYKAAVALTSSATPKVSGKVSAKEKAEVLTAAQQAAVDDTAGLEAAGNSAAATAPTPPTATAEAVAAPAKPTTEASATTQPAAASDAKPVTYAELQAAVLKLHKADATAAKPIAEGMGFANFKAMPEDKWPEALKRVQAALTERGV